MNTHPSISIDETTSQFFLTQQDVDRLISDDSAESRIDILQKISSQYVHSNFSKHEMAYAEQIFRLLMKDTEYRVRQTLANELKGMDSIPRDIVLHLTNDIPDVANLIIQYSNVPSDADLIRIIESSRETSKLIAVSNREHISERVSHALVQTNYPQVITSLLQNDNAEIAAEDYQHIVQEFSDNQPINMALIGRDNLPLAIVESLISLVSDAVAENLASKYMINLDALKAKTREAVTLQMLPINASDETIEEAITQMVLLGRLTPSIILTSLCCGHVRFFEIALAKLAGIPKANARKLVRDKGMLGFEAIYEKTQLPESIYRAVSLLLQVVLRHEKNPELSPGSYRYANVVVEELLARSDSDPVENLSYIIALVRQSVKH